MADMQALLSALNVFTGAPDKASLETANTWLQDFQHSAEAWATCNVLLLSPEDVPPAAKIFAAQTFRAKTVYDLHQVDPANLPALRDTLMGALQKYHAGPRTIIIQLSLALAALALQFPQWDNAVQSMIDAFGRNPATVPALLQFLTILPEELSNSRIPVTDGEWDERAPKLLRNNSKRLLELLSMYIQASGVTSAVQSQVLSCVRNWIAATEITTADAISTPLFSFAFSALSTNHLFDAAVDVICEFIHETQEVDENMSSIEVIVPQVIALRPQLVIAADDADKIKGYARIFSEAGETYRMLILQHTETFAPLVQAIGECSAYSDLDIVPITFPFWERLAQIMGKQTSIPPLLLEAYRSLMNVIIRHLHFPPESEPLTGQELENFRSFRHIMGDTLKDCCLVLRADTCLMAAHELLVVALSRGTSWQEVEAPLFAMRSMGAEIDPSDDATVPKIMDLIPNLPNHPRVQYAALLLICRYTEWINLHPSYIQFQLGYISAGFQSDNADVNGAAGQALRYLCQDCKQHLIDFLPTLHQFLSSIGSKLHQDDLRQVYEAIAFVISAMPMERAGESLKAFALDLLSFVHNVTLQANVSKETLQKVCDALENLEVMLFVIGSFGEELPTACQNTCAESWAVLNDLLVKFGSNYDIAERTTRVIRHGLTLFGQAALPVAASVVGRMSFSFEATGIPCYIWIAAKVVRFFGNEEAEDLRGSFQDVYERSTEKVGIILTQKVPGDIPDILEDYLHLLLELLDLAPEIFFGSSAFQQAFKVSLSGLAVVYTDVTQASLDLYRNILTHECLNLPPVPPPNFQLYASAINNVIAKEGFELTGYMLSGLAGEFVEEGMSPAISIFRTLAVLWPSQLLEWVTLSLHRLPTTLVAKETKEGLLADITSSVKNGQYDKVKYALLTFRRASRKNRERRGTRALTA